MNFVQIGSVGCARASGDMVGTFVSNSGLWGCSGGRVRIIFVFYVGLHFPNIGYSGVCEGIWKYMRVFEGI